MAPPSTLWLYPLRNTDLDRTTDGTTYVLRVTRNTTENLNFPASGSLTADRNYWFSGDAQADADGSVGGVGDLCEMLRATLATHTSGATWTVTLSAANVITIGCSAAFSILWANAATTLSALPFGFPQTDTASGASVAATNQTDGSWAPGVAFRTDSRDQQPVTTRIARSLSGRIRASRVSLPRKTRAVSYHLLAQEYILDEYAGTLRSFERMQTNGLSYGRPIRLYTDATSRTSTSYSLYVIDQDVDRPLFNRDPQGGRLRWEIPEIQLRRVTS